MNDLFTALCNLLAAEKGVYTQLVSLSRDKKDAVVANKIEDLDNIVRTEQGHLVRINELERERRRLMEEFEALAQKPAAELQIKDIIEICPEDKRPELEAIHVELVAVLDEQVKLNDVNRQLVESRLEYINFLIDTMGEETDGSNPYNSTGADARTREQRSRIIDQRV